MTRNARPITLLRAAPPDFAILAGDDAFIAPTVLAGGAGAIAASAHVCTAEFASMVSSALDGDSEAARRRSESLLPVVQAGFAEPSPAVWKAALHRLGEIDTPSLRAPMTDATIEATDVLMRAIAAATRR